MKIEEIRLSEKSLDEYINELKIKKKQIIEASANIATRLAEESCKDTYSGTEVIPAIKEDTNIVAYARTTKEGDTYAEFGTGLIGSENPHVDEILEIAGWKYDVNEHGERGWVYPNKEGGFTWTQGQPAQRKFYEAGKRAKEKTQEIAIEEFRKIKKK